ncbi:site-specific DNA-methyltransferase [Microbispora hainanensis]|uniref:Site-specific DNA-methyltransferase n=1 Tax=Microbispora hainanensis TaxID=568844 RepID=A0A544YMS6_9ACTN|nr:DNA methyltransferase [Microbispora hainanensis]TQS18063.1 site-specific DNA-methyltransferase [Microbispora hainanensis]
MAHIDALIDKVADPALRQLLHEQVATLLTRQSFGLVYQQHKPETVELYDYKVRRNCTVRILSEDDDSLYRVVKVSDGSAAIVSLTERAESRLIGISDLVVVREFGEPIYPGLRPLGSVERGASKPFHVVMNAENFHALETLLYTHERKVDIIYIDPPYNSGARDWKYNNDYVDSVDQYRHSKWLAMMERRLRCAKRLLDLSDSALVVTIDENEVHHLGMLLEQLFPEATRQLVTIVTNPKGVTRSTLSRVEEYAFFCFFGSAIASSISDDLLTPGGEDVREGEDVRPRWKGLLRSGSNSRREQHPTFFYPILIDPDTRKILGAGASPPLEENPDPDALVDGHTAVWPVRRDGTWGRWMLKPQTLREWAAKGYVALGNYDAGRKTWGISYLTTEFQNQIAAGILEVRSVDPVTGVVDAVYANEASSSRRVKTVWHRTAHDAGVGGTAVVEGLVGERAFDYPKSVYAVRDTLDLLTRHKRNAVIVDFFAGSGTTLHATAMLNAEDGGRRQCILVTNNEVGPERQRHLRAQGLTSADEEWQRQGIFRHVTRPRVEGAILGKRANGTPVPASLKNADGSQMSLGLQENVEFFDLTYEDPDLISLGKKFDAVAPLLWLKAGARGARIRKACKTWTAPDDAYYGILFDIDYWREFVEAIRKRSDITHAFIVTDSDATFQQIISELPTNVDSTQLYGDYLSTFEINTKGQV